MNTAARTARRPAPQTATEVTKARKAEAAKLIERLQRAIAATPEGSKDWGHAGNVGHAVEQLTDLVAFFEGTNH